MWTENRVLKMIATWLVAILGTVVCPMTPNSTSGTGTDKSLEGALSCCIQPVESK